MALTSCICMYVCMYVYAYIYIYIYIYQNVIQNQNIVIGNLSFENVEKFKYLGVAVTNTTFVKKLNAQ